MPVARILLCQFSRLPCFKPRWGHALGTQKSELISLRATDDGQWKKEVKYSCCHYAYAYVVSCWLSLKLFLHVLRACVETSIGHLFLSHLSTLETLIESFRSSSACSSFDGVMPSDCSSLGDAHIPKAA